MLDDTQTLKSCGITDSKAALYIDPKPITLVVHECSRGESIELTVNKGWTIEQVKADIAEKLGIAAESQALFHRHPLTGESHEVEPGSSLLENGIEVGTNEKSGEARLHLNPAEIKVFCKLPSNKVEGVNIKQCDTRATVRQKVEMHTRQSLEGTAIVCGVESMDEAKCLADYDVTDGATIRVRAANKRGSIFGHNKKPGANKWGDVAITNMHRGGAAGCLRVDYGSKFAPPCAITGKVGQLKQVKRHSILDVGQATAAKLKNKAQASLLGKIGEEEEGGEGGEGGNDEPDSEDEEKQERQLKSKMDKIAMMRHAQLASKERPVFKKGRTGTNASYQREKAYLEQNSGLETNDFDYKYTLCLMKCCPCLGPETEEEIEQKQKQAEADGLQKTKTARLVLRTKRGQVLRQQDPMCACL